jgi:hypothetical protein
MKKRDLILVVVIVVLLGAYFILRTRKPVERPQRIFSTDSLRIGSIQIVAAAESLTIKRINDEWRIVEPIAWKADEDRMRNFFFDVINASVPKTVVSFGPGAIIRYGLDEIEGNQIKVFDSKGNLRDHVIFGNAGAPHDYFRYAGEDKVYQIKRKVAYQYEPTLSDWRDPRILKIDHNQIEKIDVTYYDNSYVITREPLGWRYKDKNNDFMIDPDNRQMMRMLNVLYLLETRIFFDNDNSDDAYALSRPHCEVTIHLVGGTKRKLTFIRDEIHFKLMLDDDRSTLYGVLGDTLDRFTRSAEVFNERYGQPAQN